MPISWQSRGKQACPSHERRAHLSAVLAHSFLSPSPSPSPSPRVCLFAVPTYEYSYKYKQICMRPLGFLTPATLPPSHTFSSSSCAHTAGYRLYCTLHFSRSPAFLEMCPRTFSGKHKYSTARSVWVLLTTCFLNDLRLSRSLQHNFASLDADRSGRLDSAWLCMIMQRRARHCRDPLPSVPSRLCTRRRTSQLLSQRLSHSPHACRAAPRRDSSNLIISFLDIASLPHLCCCPQSPPLLSSLLSSSSSSSLSSRRRRSAPDGLARETHALRLCPLSFVPSPAWAELRPKLYPLQ